MGYQRPNTPSSSSAGAAPATRRNRQGQEFEAALGFINMYVPTSGGKRLKLGTIALQASNGTQKQIFEKLNVAQTDEERAEIVSRLVGILQFDFNPQLDADAPENQIVGF